MKMHRFVFLVVGLLCLFVVVFTADQLRTRVGHWRAIKTTIVNMDGERLSSVFAGAKPNPANAWTPRRALAARCSSPSQMTLLDRVAAFLCRRPWHKETARALSAADRIGLRRAWIAQARGVDILEFERVVVAKEVID